MPVRDLTLVVTWIVIAMTLIFWVTLTYFFLSFVQTVDGPLRDSTLVVILSLAIVTPILLIGTVLARARHSIALSYVLLFGAWVAMVAPFATAGW
jgi:hypothetical protein